jgi:hypothetical protein
MHSRCDKHMICQCLWCYAQVLVTVTPGVLHPRWQAAPAYQPVSPARSLPSLPPAARWASPVGAVSLARTLTLSVPRTPPVSPSLTSRPRPPPWTRPHPRVLQPPPHNPRPFRASRPARPLPPAHLRPQPSSLAPSLALRTQPDKLHRRSPKAAAVPRPPLSPYRVRCPAEFRLAVSNSGYPLVHLLPL